MQLNDRHLSNFCVTELQSAPVQKIIFSFKWLRENVLVLWVCPCILTDVRIYSSHTRQWITIKILAYELAWNVCILMLNFKPKFISIDTLVETNKSALMEECIYAAFHKNVVIHSLFFFFFFGHKFSFWISVLWSSSFPTVLVQYGNRTVVIL